MAQNTGPSSDKLRILIADDVTETRRATRLMLTAIPHTEVVAIARNGREAVEMTRQHRPDIALMDVNMPEMNGIAAIDKMLTEWPGMACIVISAERDTQTLLSAMSAGASAYLTKPFTGDQLKEAIWRVVQRLHRMRTNAGRTVQIRQQRDHFLKELANEYIRTRRTDAKAMEVLEILAQDPQCEPRLLTALAMIYALNQEWGKLKVLAARLEHVTGAVARGQ